VDLHRIGRYLVTGVLGRGAAGVVYRAHDPVIDREIALKAVPTDDADPDAVEFRARFLREARAAGRLSHPGIVTVYDVGEDEAHRLLFLTMEFIEGCSLKDVMAAGVRLDDREVASLGARLADALDVAHRHGVVHRDLKPANVLLSRAGEVKLVDFGVARLDTSDLTRDGSSVGTPFYMSPEQIFGRSVDGRSDLYSLGVILYELVAGRRPFSATGIGDLAVQIADDPPPPLAELRPDLARSLAPIVHRLLEKRPEDRLQSGRAVAGALQAFGLDDDDDAIRRAVDRATPRRDPARDDPTPAPRSIRDGLDTQAVGESSSVALSHPGGRWWIGLAIAATVVVAGILAVAAMLTSEGAHDPPSPTVDTAAMHDDVGRLRAAADLLEAGDPEAALRIAEDVLDRRPRSDAAAKLVDAAAVARSPVGPLDIPTPTAPPTTARQRPRSVSGAMAATPIFTATPSPVPTPVSPVLEVVFPNPLSEGSLVIEIDFERIEEIRWDASDGEDGRSGEGPPEVRREVVLPVGAHQLEVQLHAGRRGQIGMAEFDREFGPGSRWRVLVDVPGRRQRPTFRLERTVPPPGT